MSETGCEVAIPRRRHPKDIVSSPYQYLGCQEGCHDCPSPSGPFALVSATRALEPEHVEERYVQRWVQILPTAVGS
ncbi:hypothetical protein SRHO_G00215190 [Serrasalmus rhombeus]